MALDDEVIETRLEIGCEGIGFTPPPFTVRLKILRAAAAYTAYAQSWEGPAGAIADWLRSLGAGAIQFSPRHDGVLRAEFSSLPSAWHRLTRRIRVRDLAMFPNGRISLSLEGNRDDVLAFTNPSQKLVPGLVVHRVAAATNVHRLLTPRQGETMTRAVADGYYEIPRRVNLVALAKRMSRTSASLSECLRRAEARVITQYIESRTGLYDNSLDSMTGFASGREESDDSPENAATRRQDPWPRRDRKEARSREETTI